jgi:hypothetical protein
MLKGVRVTLGVLLLILITGCSAHRSNLDLISCDIFSGYQTDGVLSSELAINTRVPIATWAIRFTKDCDFKLREFRLSQSHFNVTYQIPPPIINITEFNPATNVVNVDVTLTNPTSINVYDVRLVIMTDDKNHLLLNPDNWTDLYDFPGGLAVNPFKAYCKDNPSRIFEAQTQHTENLLIYLPQGNTNVYFVVDASIGRNCHEPYMINNFQQGAIYNQTGSSASIKVDVFDWQNDVNRVFLHCPRITGQPIVDLTQEDVNTWKGNLVNYTGAGSGDYIGYIVAESADSGTQRLFDQVSISISGKPGPYDPQVVSITTPFQSFSDIAFKDNNAFIANFCEAGVTILDISDPVEPVIIRHFQPFPRSVIIRGNYLFALCGELTDWDSLLLRIFNIEDTINPLLVGELRFENQLIDIQLKDNYAFIYGDGPGVKIVDISDLSNPYLAADFPLENVSNLTVNNNLLVTSSYTSDVKLFDISDPLNAQLLSTISGYHVSNTATTGNYLYMSANFKSLIIADISDPYNPQILDTTDFGLSCYILINEDYAYMSGSHSFILDIRNPADPQLVTQFEQVGDELYFYNNSLYVNYHPQGLYTWDVTDTALPEFLYSIIVSGIVQDMDVEGDYLYFTNTYYAMNIVDIHDKAEPVFISRLYHATHLFTPNCITVRDDLAYVSTLLEGVAIVDINDPYNPVLINKIYDLRWPGKIELSGNYAFVPCETDGIFSVDISDPLNAYVLDEYSFYLTGMALGDGDIVWAASSDLGVRAIDISDPSNMLPAGNWFNLQAVNSIEYCDNRIYQFHNIRFSIVDVSVPSQPKLEGVMDMDGSLSATKVADRFVYLAKENEGLMIIDVTISEYPAVLKILPTIGRAKCVDVVDNYAYLMTSNEGLIIYKLW